MKKLLTFTAIIFGSFWLDNWFIELAHVIKGTLFGEFLLVLTDAGTITFVIIVLYALFVEKKRYTILLAIFALIITAEIGILIKVLTQVPRPYAGDEVFLTLGSASGFSFPSNHAALVFCLFAFAAFIFPKKKNTLFLITGFFALTRALLGVHYFSDVVGGGVIGFYIASVLIEKAEKKGVVEKIMKKVKDELELRRQIAHIITGFSIIFVVKYNLLSLNGLLIILIVGGILSFVMRTREVPIATPILRWFEREKYIKKFPGRGSFFFVLGSFLSLVFFQQEIAFAAIAIMSIGDAVNNIVGTYFGKILIFYNKKKHIEGLIVAILTGTIAGLHFVPFMPALIATTIAMVIETIPFAIGPHEIDDNIVIPLVASATLSFLI